MKHIILLSAFSALSAVKSPAAELPPVAVPGKSALISTQQIFDLANKPTKECHASTIAETPTGLVVAWFAGTRERDLDVGIRVSRQENGKWTAPVEVVNGVQSSDLRYPCWNPVLFQPEDGPLMLFYKVGPHPRQWWGMLTTSEDGGKTWCEPRMLCYEDGSMVCVPASLAAFERDPHTGKAYWFANILDHPVTKQTPRYPLAMAEMDTDRFCLIKDSVTPIQDFPKGAPANRSYTNFGHYVDRVTGEFVLTPAEAPKFNTRDFRADTVRYRIKVIPG